MRVIVFRSIVQKEKSEAFINNLRGVVSQTIVHLNENDPVSANQEFERVGSFLHQLYRAGHPMRPSRHVA